VYRLCMLSVFVVIFIVFLTPATFLNYIDALLFNLGLLDIFDYLLQNYLSTLILLIYQSVILPKFIEYLVKKEKQVDRAREMVSALRKYLIYNLVYVFLIPVAGISFAKMVQQIYNDGFSKWQVFIAESISHAGLFFTNFIIHQTFIIQGVNLLTPARLLEIKTKQVAAISQEEKLMAYECEEYSWAAEYAKSITNLTIILCISIIYPLILPFGLLYFCVKLGVQKYLMLCVYHVNPYVIGNRLLRSILTSLLFAVLVFQWISSTQLIISGSKHLRILGAVIGILGLAVFVLTYRKAAAFIKMFKKKLIKARIMPVSEPLISSDSRKYLHPIEARLMELDNKI
jgi:hypothetical protein